MALTIPKRFEPAFAKFINLRLDAISALVEAARQAIPAPSIRIYASRIGAAQNMSLSKDDLYNIFLMLGSLSHVRADGNWPSLDEFVRDLIDAAKQDATLRPPEGWDNLANNLRSLLDTNGSLAISAKASELRTEHQRVICVDNCRVLTDLRPVFLENVKQSPKAIILQHILKLAYHDDSSREPKEFFVALDGEDLRRLKSLIERAITKENSLRSSARIEGAAILMDGNIADGNK